MAAAGSVFCPKLEAGGALGCTPRVLALTVRPLPCTGCESATVLEAQEMRYRSCLRDAAGYESYCSGLGHWGNGSSIPGWAQWAKGSGIAAVATHSQSLAQEHLYAADAPVKITSMYCMMFLNLISGSGPPFHGTRRTCSLFFVPRPHRPMEVPESGSPDTRALRPPLRDPSSHVHGSFRPCLGSWSLLKASVVLVTTGVR